MLTEAQRPRCKWYRQDNESIRLEWIIKKQQWLENNKTTTAALDNYILRKAKQMKKLLIKWFLPSADQIADMAVNAVADFINTSDKTETIAKYGTAADEFTKIQAKLTNLLKDGKIDDAEKVELKTLILPLAEKLVKEVTK